MSVGPRYTPVELLERLVAFDTTSHRSNMPLIAFVADYLAQHGVMTELVATPDGTKANLIATIGRPGTPGVALSGHTDVVPVDGQSWSSDPFKVTERAGRLFGRGTADMKGFIACVLAAVPDFRARDLQVPLHIILSYDEEIGCVGVRPLIQELGRRWVVPRMVIVGEPTSMQVVDAHKGPVRWQVDVRGRAAHSSMAHLGVNAITYAGRLLGELERIEQELAEGRRDDRFTPPFSTLQVTKIEGGTASNIVPVGCRFGFEVRALPDLDTAAVEERLRAFSEAACESEMRERAAEAGIRIEQTNQVPPFAADHASGAVALALALAEADTTSAVSYATEAGLFQEAGAPAVVCGPGDIAQAHTADEWIAVDQIEACAAFLGRLADWAEAQS